MELPAETRTLLSEGGLVITANARAARALRSRYADEQQGAGHRVWAAPQITDYDSWLQTLWRELLLDGSEDRLLLNPLQEQSLWLRIVTPLVRQQSLISPDGIAALAQEAYALLCDYSALDRVIGRAGAQPWGAQDAETELFRNWTRSFHAECIRQRWIVRADLSAGIAAAIPPSIIEGRMTLPSTIGLVGFDRVTPAQHTFQEALQRAGTQIRTLTSQRTDVAIDSGNGTRNATHNNRKPWNGSQGWLFAEPRFPITAVATVFTAASIEDEATACAWWCRQHLERDPGLRIGVIVPDLRATRAYIERTFLRVLAPEALSIEDSPDASLPFEFSLGLPLSQTPLTQSALLLLKWFSAPLRQSELSWLLLSGFLPAPASTDNGSTENLDAAKWDADLRDSDLSGAEMSLHQLLQHPASRRAGIAGVTRKLRDALDQFRREPALASHRRWCSVTEHLLEIAGWSGTRSADSVQYQAWIAWQRLLERVASLDLTGGRVNYDLFLRTLAQAAEATIFAAESHDAQVQISGVLESSGQQFDAVWFMSADDTHWPPRGRPHPLLPLGVQRELDMPHATPEVDWQLAAELTRRVQDSARDCVFSYARQDDNGVLRCSPLVRDLPPSSFAPPIDREGYVSALDTFLDDDFLPWPIDRAAGGQEVLAKQSACAFQAFASRRLGARELPSAERGLSPAERGKLLHTVLEGIWSKDLPAHPPLRSRQDLVSAEINGTLLPLIQEHVRLAMQPVLHSAEEPWQRAYLAAEERRLVALVSQWMTVERDRTSFAVEECERKIDITVGDLKLHVRADRIDRVADGRLLLDYKTGLVTPARWEGERPEEPQLPLYAAYGGIDDLAGVLLGQVRSVDPSFKGRVRDAELNLFSGLTAKNPLVKDPYTEELREQWRDTLERLAGAFTRGEAQVDPRQYPKTCQYCAFPSLCRVAETSAALREDDLDTEEGGEGPRP